MKETNEDNFGTAYGTYKQSVKTDSSITPQDVKGYLGKRDDIQGKTKPKTCNRFVYPGAKCEFETDLMDIESKDATSNNRYGLTAVDNFIEVVPIKNLTPEAMING